MKVWGFIALIKRCKLTVNPFNKATSPDFAPTISSVMDKPGLSQCAAPSNPSKCVLTPL